MPRSIANPESTLPAIAVRWRVASRRPTGIAFELLGPSRYVLPGFDFFNVRCPYGTPQFLRSGSLRQLTSLSNPRIGRGWSGQFWSMYEWWRLPPFFYLCDYGPAFAQLQLPPAEGGRR